MRVGLLLLPALAACEVEDWRNADLQLDVTGADLVSTDLVKICVEGVGSRQVALGAGRAAYPGLPAEGALTVTVDALSAAEDTGSGDTGDSGTVRLGRAGPVEFDGLSLLETAWEPCQDGACEPCREAAVPVDETETRLLAVRFLGLD